MRYMLIDAGYCEVQGDGIDIGDKDKNSHFMA